MGDCPLTAHQLSLVELLADGLTYKQIAERKGVAHSTVRTTLMTAYRRLGAVDRAQAVLICVKAGWLDLAAPVSPHRLLRKLEESVRELVDCIESRRRVTPAQREYLIAFDRLLRARSDEEKIAARASMDAALGPALGGVVPQHRQRRDLVELLAEYVERARAT